LPLRTSTKSKRNRAVISSRLAGRLAGAHRVSFALFSAIKAQNLRSLALQGSWTLAANNKSAYSLAESKQSLSRLGEGLLSKSSKIMQRPFLLQKAAAQAHWTDTPGQYVPDYNFQEQLQGRSQRYIDGMELVQCSIMNAPDDALPDKEKQDWITFLKRGHRKNEKEVANSITTPGVLQAFESARLGNPPGEVRERYVEEDLDFDRYSEHTNMLVREGVREGEHNKASEIARKMLFGGRPLEEIVEYSGLTKEEVEAMTTSASHEDRCKS
jgi:hypothetical protein